MTLLTALGLVPPAALMKTLAGALEGGDTPPAERGGEAKKPPPKATAKKKEATPGELSEYAKWPGKAHLAWKSLDTAEQSSVVSQMGRRYGTDFARTFVARTKGGQRIESHDYVPALEEQTSEYMKAKGYALAQKAGTDEIGQEWWVHPNGHEIYLQRHLKGWKSDDGTAPPPAKTPDSMPKPPPKTGLCDSGEQEYLALQLGWLKDALEDAKTRSEQWAAAKAALDKMNVTSKEFEKAFKEQTTLLKQDEDWLNAKLSELEDAETAIKDSGCDAKDFSSGLEALRERVYERDNAQMELDMRKPLNLGVKTEDGDDDGSDE